MATRVAIVDIKMGLRECGGKELPSKSEPDESEALKMLQRNEGEIRERIEEFVRVELGKQFFVQEVCIYRCESIHLGFSVASLLPLKEIAEKLSPIIKKLGRVLPYIRDVLERILGNRVRVEEVNVYGDQNIIQIAGSHAFSTFTSSGAASRLISVFLGATLALIALLSYSFYLLGVGELISSDLTGANPMLLMFLVEVLLTIVLLLMYAESHSGTPSSTLLNLLKEAGE